MNHKKIIAEAWEFTQNNKRIIKVYALVPALISILAGVIYIMYQFFAFKSSRLFENWQQGFTYMVVQSVFDILRANSGIIGPLIGCAIVVAILYLFVPSFCEGALIQLVARKKNGQAVRTRDGISYGFFSFLPLFEYSLVIRSLSIGSLFSLMATLARNLGWEALNTFMPLFILIGIIGLLLTIFSTYSEFFIVIDNKKMFESIGLSFMLVVTHWEATIMLAILMIIISVRILIQIIFVLLIPAVIVFTIYMFASSTIPTAGLLIAGVLGLVTIYLAAYLSATIHMFAASVWTITFLELTDNPPPTAREKGGEEDDDVTVKNWTVSYLPSDSELSAEENPPAKHPGIAPKE